MKAAVFYSPRDIRIEEIEVPKLSEKEVLIKVKAAGICGSDLHYYKGEGSRELPSGTVLGHEFSGEVVAIGEEVTNIKVGNRVAVEPLIGCGKCLFCQIGKYHLCNQLRHIGFELKGAFAQYTKAPEKKAFKLPNNVSYEEAALLDCYAVSVHAIHRVKVEVNNIVVIFGGGPLGLTTLEVVKATGAKKVIVVDLSDNILQIAKNAGADIVINASKVDVIKEINKVTNELGADIVFDCVGGMAPTFGQAIQVVRPGGTIGIIGVYSEFPQMNLRKAYTKEINIVFIWSYAKWGIFTEFEIALDMLAQGKLNATPLITHKFPLNEIRQAFTIAENKKDFSAVKVLITPWINKNKKGKKNNIG